MKLRIPPAGAAIIFTLLAMGLFGLLVVAPIGVIQMAWNTLMKHYELLPLINVWQAALLYLAIATLFYLTGLVRIEIGSVNDKVE